jgi:hypothetical protein
LFIFDDRIEIISPGHLPNNLTVEKIRAGMSNIRNPILASYVAKGVLPYRGLGSGIKRALKDWPDIDFTDDRDRCLFIATVKRKPMDQLRVVSPAETRLSADSPKMTEVVTEEVTEAVIDEVGRLVHALQGEMKRSELQAALGLRHEVHFRDAYLLPSLAAGLIEMTHPDKPTSSKQRYRLTAKGQSLRQKP